MPAKLGADAVQEMLADVGGWSVVDGKLHREFKFAGFVQAFGFMASAALEAEKLDHHPEWSNVYNKVVVDLVTHSAGGITELDFLLARKMSELAAGGQ